MTVLKKEINVGVILYNIKGIVCSELCMQEKLQKNFIQSANTKHIPNVNANLKKWLRGQI